MGFLGILLLYNESAQSIYNDFQVIKAISVPRISLNSQILDALPLDSSSRRVVVTPVSEHMDLRIGGPEYRQIYR